MPQKHEVFAEELRILRGPITQADLAHSAYMSESTLSRIVTGKKDITRDDVIAVIKALIEFKRLTTAQQANRLLRAGGQIELDTKVDEEDAILKQLADQPDPSIIVLDDIRAVPPISPVVPEPVAPPTTKRRLDSILPVALFLVVVAASIFLVLIRKPVYSIPIPNPLPTPPVPAPTYSPDGKMVLVPAGPFIQGSAQKQIEEYEKWCRTARPTDTTCGTFGDELPQRTVTLDAFWIDRYEVTNRQYQEFINAHPGYRTQAETNGYSYIYDPRPDNPKSIKTDGLDWRHPLERFRDIEERLDYPVVHLDWYEANDYCEWRGKRLPTEAEWEKAARGVDGRPYPWGFSFNLNEDQGLLNSYYFRGIEEGILSVGRFPKGASPYGTEDMMGNVFEWVADWYVEDYYSKAPAVNPPGPTPTANSPQKVRRGGSWATDPSLTRVTWRSSTDPLATHINVGFRCAQTKK